MNNIFFFKDIGKKDIRIAGGKGASLGEMTQAGIPVPPGFIITSDTFKQYSSSSLPQGIKNEILEAFNTLGAQRVAVRSSAIAEDSSNASWAGQLESYLNVESDKLIEKIEECWKSIKTERAKSYAEHQNISDEDLIVAVVVQKMVESEYSGIAFSANPVNKNHDEIMIEASYGLGEMIVQGMITPDNYVLNKNTLEIISKNHNHQDKMLTFTDSENREVDVPEDKIGKQILEEGQLKTLGELIIKIENHYGSPQDIEWAYENSEFYIVQSRPITTL